ncbi:MAG: hypothetical protein NT145_08005 [Elusimicrobia bacterium]|nr:hypothetical protein [Elusimicrobiota bacterium]
MKKIIKIINLRLYLCLIFVLSVFSEAQVFPGDYISKEHRNLFVPPTLQENFYKVEVQTLHFFDRQKSSINGLVESFRGSSRYAYDLFTQAFTFGRGGVLDAQSFTYDCAVSALCYLIAGQSKKTADILDIYAMDFYNQKNGAIGLYNSYATDKPYDNSLAVGIDSRVHLGPNMWVAIAALQYTALTGDLKYLDFIIDMIKWAMSLNHHQYSDGKRGGVSMGFGWGPDWSQVYSTENNIDYYAVLKMLKEIYNSGNVKAKKIFEKRNFGLKDIDEELNGLTRWFKEVVYDNEKKYLYMGYNEKGPDKVAALDTVSWAITGITPEDLVKMGIDPFKLMDFAERTFRVADYINGVRVEGYDFTDVEGRKNNFRMIWMEGTAFQTVAFQVMSQYAKKMGLKNEEEKYRSAAIRFSGELERVSILVNFADNALPYTSKNPKEQEIVLSFANEWEIPRGNDGQWVASASSTGWRYFALTGFNPMVFDKDNVSYALFSKPKASSLPEPPSKISAVSSSLTIVSN